MAVEEEEENRNACSDKKEYMTGDVQDKLWLQDSCNILVVANQQLGSSPILYTHRPLWLGSEF
jgi:hypothetical protein